MKHYRGLGDRQVQVRNEGGGTWRPLEHHVQHSPDGFSWGYAGSGPAELARCLLWDHLGEEPHPACYQAFKFDFVSSWPQGIPWTLTSAEVSVWLDLWVRSNPGRHITIAAYDRWLHDGVEEEARA